MVIGILSLIAVGQRKRRSERTCRHVRTLDTSVVACKYRQVHADMVSLRGVPIRVHLKPLQPGGFPCSHKPCVADRAGLFLSLSLLASFFSSGMFCEPLRSVGGGCSRYRFPNGGTGGPRHQECTDAPMRMRGLCLALIGPTFGNAAAQRIARTQARAVIVCTLPSPELKMIPPPAVKPGRRLAFLNMRC